MSTNPPYNTTPAATWPDGKLDVEGTEPSGVTSGRSRPMIVDTVRNAATSRANPIGNVHACERCPVSHSMAEAPNATPITVQVSVNDDPTAAAVSSRPTRCRAIQSVQSSSTRPTIESNTKSSPRAPTNSMTATRTAKPDRAVVATRLACTVLGTTTGPIPTPPAAHSRREPHPERRQCAPAHRPEKVDSDRPNRAGERTRVLVAARRRAH